MPRNVLTVNALLEEAGVDLRRTKLVRHSAGKHKLDMFGEWLHRRAEFERYQSLQSKPRFDEANHIVSFVAGGEGDTLFVGVYGVRGKLGTPVGEVEPLSGNIVQPQHLLYDLALTELLAEYRGRLLVDWGKGWINWVHRGTIPKLIVELRRRDSEPPFPGYQRFTARLTHVSAMPSAWHAALKLMGGAYLLTHEPDGRLYVGAAHGVDGFYGRWMEHAMSPNPIKLRKVKAEDLTVSILELSDLAWGKDAALAAEARWKRRLRPALCTN